MMVVAARFEDLQHAAQATNWRGRSGRFYGLVPLAMSDFSLDGPDVYLLARGSHVLWVGTAAEVIGDATRRAHFRLALREAKSAFRIAAPGNEIDRMTLAWDLEGGEPVLGLRLT